MSDPVANVDIEDVLSSIRRLVSNAPDKGEEASGVVRDADRLVLTPSQRVDDAPDEDEAGSAAAAPDRPSLQAAVTDTAPPEREAPEPPAPGAVEMSEPMTEAEPDPEPESIFPQDDDGRAEDGTENGTGHDAEARGDDTPDPELDGIAAMFARHDAAPTAWEPDGDDEDAFAEGAEAPALDWRDADSGDDGANADEDARPERAAERAATVERDWGTDAPDDAENAFAIDDEAVLDEEALRDLVAEIVREELMGTLGERITRNVRKLVRREIHRALNSQDFD